MIGRVIATREVADAGPWGNGLEYTFRVEETLKGPRFRTITFFTERHSAVTYLDEKASRAIVFAAWTGRGQNGDSAARARYRWLVLPCSAAMTDDSEALIRQTKEAFNSKVTSLQIDASEMGASETPLSEQRFTVRGPGVVRTVKAGKNGVVRLRVPPGKYSVTPLATGFRESTYSWDDPSDLRLRAGQCGMVRFERDH